MTGPLEPLKDQRGRNQRGQDTGERAMQAKGKHNFLMALILMVLMAGFLLAIFAQVQFMPRPFLDLDFSHLYPSSH